MRERKFIIVKNDKPIIRVGYVLYHHDLLNKEGLDNIAGSNLTIANAIIEGSRIIAWQDKHYGAFAGI